MFQAKLVVFALVVATAVHGIVCMMALLNFMWLTAALAGLTTMIGLYAIDQLAEVIE